MDSVTIRTLLAFLLFWFVAPPFHAAAAEAARLITVSGSLNFGRVPVGSDKTNTILLKNVGNSPVKINGISYPAGFSGNFSGTIAAGKIQRVAVTFKPLAIKAYSGKLTISSNKTGGTGTASISGSGIAGTRILSLGGNLTFGSVPLGDSKTAHLNLRNNGNSPLKVSKISLPDGFSGKFSGVIAPGGLEKVKITFKPSSTKKAYTGRVIVTSNKTSGPDSRNISGTGEVAHRVLSLSGNLAFGNLPAKTKKNATLTLKNTGNSPLTIRKLTLPEGFSGKFSGSIAPKGSQKISITFAPTEAKKYSGNLEISSNKTSGSPLIPLSGKGTASRILAAETRLDFGDVYKGGSKTETLTLRNTGSHPLKITKLTLPKDFSGSFSGTIAPGAKQKIKITFKPTKPKTYSGKLTITSNKTAGPEKIALKGISYTLGPATGVIITTFKGDFASWTPLTPSFSIMSADFGEVPLGYSRTKTTTILNNTDQVLKLTEISYPEGFSGPSSATLDPKGSLDIDITFTPTASRSYDGEISAQPSSSYYMRIANYNRLSGYGVPLRQNADEMTLGSLPELIDLKKDASGDRFVLGALQNESGITKAYSILKIKPDGSAVWRREFAPESEIRLLPNGEAFVVGLDPGSEESSPLEIPSPENFIDTTLFIEKLSAADGMPVWSTNYTFEDPQIPDQTFNITTRVDSQNNLTIIGSFLSSTTLDAENSAIKVDGNNGDLIISSPVILAPGLVLHLLGFTKLEDDIIIIYNRNSITAYDAESMSVLWNKTPSQASASFDLVEEELHFIRVHEVIPTQDGAHEKVTFRYFGSTGVSF